MFNEANLKPRLDGKKSNNSVEELELFTAAEISLSRIASAVKVAGIQWDILSKIFSYNS